ncbi:MAG: sigma 54-interacting transcriptional regulator [Lachnospiraceae bacterium]|nr:sigma 54-interacting transcriptional regulator [Lachnospiraceae bacterium]
MEQNILYKMLPSLERYAEVISQLVRMPVTVVDDQMIRIVSKGENSNLNVGASLELSGYILQAAIDSGKPQMMTRPKGHPACRRCEERDTCRDVAQMLAPIVANGKVLGVIGFVSDDQKQWERIRGESGTYFAFIEQIANLIAFEAMQQTEADRNRELLSMMDFALNRTALGILMLDGEGNIQKINRTGRTLIEERLYQLGEQPIAVEATGEKLGQMDVYRLSCGSGSCCVAGSLYQVSVEHFDRVLIFTDDAALRRRERQPTAFSQIKGVSQQIMEVRERIRSSALSPSNVLLYAEDGLRKELYAQAIHEQSVYADKPFVRIDCGMLPAQQTEEYLFGVAGTGGAGSRGRPGRLEAAAGGTLFLNDVDALPLAIQQKLLPLLERHEMRRIGSQKSRKVSFRVIASTSADLVELCAKGRFQRGLLYLLDVLPIEIPPLREHKEDLRPLALEFLSNCARTLGKKITDIDPAFWESVEGYDWPGNIRELKSAMEYVVNMQREEGKVSADLLPQRIRPESVGWTNTSLNLPKLEEETFRRALQ